MKPFTLALRPTVLIAFFAALFAAAATLNADDDVSTFELDGINSVEFSITRGNVNLVGTDRADLQLTLEKPMMGFDPDTIEQTVERVGDKLVIKITYEEVSSGWFWSSKKYKGYSDAELLLPKDITASIRTAGGNVSAESIQSPLTLHTSGGNVIAKDINASLTAKTSGGNIKLSTINGDTYAHTSGGNVFVKDLTGKGDFNTSGGHIDISGAIPALKAHTSGGSIEVDLKSALQEPLDLDTSGGNISATLVEGLSAPASLSTSGGSVSLWVPENQSFDLYAKTNGGHISLNHPGTFQGKLNRKFIDGTINGGGPRVKLTTNGGGIRISKL